MHATAAGGLLVGLLITVCASGGLAGVVDELDDHGPVPSAAVLREQVGEPLFAFILSMTAHDSVGTWTAADVIAFADAWGERSTFPLRRHLDSIAREVIPPGQRPRIRYGVSTRRWTLRLRPERVDLPMPFQILGYRPGKLSFQGPIQFDEWQLGRRDLALHRSSDEPVEYWTVDALTIYQLSAGWIILDVHPWVDRLLGSALDDQASEGFTIGWVDGALIAVGNSNGRQGRRIYGEMDLRTGRIDPRGRPLALAISRYSRAWTRPPGHDVRAVWEAYGR
jgi:hypothetical protein